MDTILEMNKSDEFDYFNYMITHSVATEQLVDLIKQTDHKEFVNNGPSINYTCSRLSNVCENTTFEVNYENYTLFIEIPTAENVIEHTYSNALILFSFYEGDTLKRYINLSPYDVFVLMQGCTTLNEVLDAIKIKTFDDPWTEYNPDIQSTVKNDIFDYLLDD